LTYESHLHEWRRLGGNKDRLEACRTALDDGVETPEACLEFYENFIATTEQGVADANVGGYDIAHPNADPFPLPHLHGYLTEESVLAALGVPVNYSSVSLPVNQVFNFGTFDLLRPGFMESIGKLLDGGVKVHMVYGDRYAPFSLPPFLTTTITNIPTATGHATGSPAKPPPSRSPTPESPTSPQPDTPHSSLPRPLPTLFPSA